MKSTILIIFSLFLFVTGLAQTFTSGEIKNLKKKADKITIINDRNGVPHVYAKTDAGTVFGMMYVQCGEFFEKVENSLISRLGRTAELRGESSLHSDLWTRMFIDSTKAKAFYHESPKWLQKLCDAYADGINYYMITHPQEKPKLITRVEPWMALMNNVPGIGGSNVDESKFKEFYLKDFPAVALNDEPEEIPYDGISGSNGFAIGPSKTASGNAMLLINPHSAYYGRIEIQLVSKRGLNAYGAPFLGQFNIFQGFNENLGWMHPITLSDAKDLYAESIVSKNGSYFYQYNGDLLPVDTAHITVKYKDGDTLNSKTFVTYYTHHGPVVSGTANEWITLKSLSANIDLLSMHWKKMKTKNFKQFNEVMNKRVMVGNNILYADKDGNYGYWHGNFVPVKTPELDWKRPVDGTTDATEWKGPYALDEIPYYFNPEIGWVQNCNSTILYGAGSFDSLMYKEKPGYMFPDGHTPRAESAIRVLNALQNASVDDVVKAAHDPYLYGGKRHVPNLLSAYESLKDDPKYAALAQPIAVLKQWDYIADTTSVGTTLATLWVEKMIPINLEKLPSPRTQEESYSVTNGARLRSDDIPAAQRLDSLARVIDELQRDFGTWEVAWGELNRFQRLEKENTFDDNRKSWAVTATPGYMGSLNAYVSRKAKNTKRRYGATGNTFVAVVEFGDKLRGKSILTGGASSDPDSPHYTDQVEGYISGDYKDIIFYKKDVLDGATKIYKPGQE